MDREIDWEAAFAEQDKQLEKKIFEGKIEVNDKPRYICVGCE